MSTFQPSALSNPTEEMMGPSAPQLSVAYKAPTPWTPQAFASSAGQMGAGITNAFLSVLKKDDSAAEAEALALAQAQAEADAAAAAGISDLGATPWIIGGVAIVGVIGAIWAFWPRED